MNIFVAKLNFDTLEDDLRAAFETYGAVDSAKIIMGRGGGGGYNRGGGGGGYNRGGGGGGYDRRY